MGFKDIDIPEGKDPEDYSYMERRAELFSYIIEAGHPDLLNQTEFAKRYGVTQPTISKDIKRIREDIRDELGTDADLIIYSIFQKGLRDLVRRERYEKAMEFAKEWGEWLFDRADSGVERAASKHDIDADVRQAAANFDTRFQVVMGDGEMEDIGSLMGEYENGELGFASTPNSGDTSLSDPADLDEGEEILIEGPDDAEE